MKAEAWFLHKRPSGETSLRVGFFTREYGIVEALYKGGRMPKKQALLQPFTPLWLDLDVRRDWYYVRALECESPALSLQGQALFAGLYVNEILHSMFKLQDASSALFAIYVDTLQSLTHASENITIEPILRRFERALLDAAGYALPLTHEASSGRPIEATQYYQFITGVGFVASQHGFLGAHILAFSEGKLDDVDTLRAVKMMMRKAIAHAMDGKVIQTRSLYRVC